MPEPLQALIGYKLTNFGPGSVDYQNPIETVKKRLSERAQQSEFAYAGLCETGWINVHPQESF